MGDRKRDRDRLAKDAQAAAKKAAREELRQAPRAARELRAPAVAAEVEVVHMEPQQRRGGPLALEMWVPSEESVVEVEGEAPRVVIGVHADDVPSMLRWVAPALATTIEPKLARRSASARGRRGASIIFTTAISSSGPHKDDEDTLLLSVSGERRVWFAAPRDVDERVLKRTTQKRLGAPVYLPAEFDPSCNPPRDGVRWREPVLLMAGDAMWLPRGCWHCVSAPPGAVAMPLEIHPRVLRHAAPRKLDVRSGRYISTRAGWGLAWNACRTWSNALR